MISELWCALKTSQTNGLLHSSKSRVTKENWQSTVVCIKDQLLTKIKIPLTSSFFLYSKWLQQDNFASIKVESHKYDQSKRVIFFLFLGAGLANNPLGTRSLDFFLLEKTYILISFNINNNEESLIWVAFVPTFHTNNVNPPFL